MNLQRVCSRRLQIQQQSVHEKIAVDLSVQQAIQITTKSRYRLNHILDESEDECDRACSAEPKEGDDVLLDQMENLFSTLGTLWSLGNTIPTAVLFSTLYSTKDKEGMKEE